MQEKPEIDNKPSIQPIVWDIVAVIVVVLATALIATLFIFAFDAPPNLLVPITIGSAAGAIITRIVTAYIKRR